MFHTLIFYNFQVRENLQNTLIFFNFKEKGYSTLAFSGNATKLIKELAFPSSKQARLHDYLNAHPVSILYAYLFGQ